MSSIRSSVIPLQSLKYNTILLSSVEWRGVVASKTHRSSSTPKTASARLQPQPLLLPPLHDYNPNPCMCSRGAWWGQGGATQYIIRLLFSVRLYYNSNFTGATSSIVDSPGSPLVRGGATQLLLYYYASILLCSILLYYDTTRFDSPGARWAPVGSTPEGPLRTCRMRKVR